MRILTEPKNALLQFRKLLELDGVELEFTEDALLAIAKGDDLKTGARGLRAIMEEACRHHV